MGMRPVIRIERGDSDDRFRDKVNRNFMTLAQEARLGADTKRNALIEDVNEYTDDVVAPVSEFSMEAAALAADALAAAGEASAKAGLKNAIYWQATPPAAPAEGHKVGDIWFDTSYDSGGIVKNAVNKWTGSAWELQPLSDSAIGNLSAGKITAGVVNVAITLNAATINGGLITGSTLQTAASGLRLEISSSVHPDWGASWISFFGTSTQSAQLGSNDLSAGFQHTNGAGISLGRTSIGLGGLESTGSTVINDCAEVIKDYEGHVQIRLLPWMRHDYSSQSPDDTGIVLKALAAGGVLQIRTGDDGGYADVHADTLFALTNLRTDSYLQMKEQGGTNSVRNMYLWTDGTTWQLRFFVGAALKKLTFTA